MKTTFLTGLPGFIGTRLARRLLDDDDRKIIALVYPDGALLDKARTFAAAHAGRVEVVPGDISKPLLGLDGKTHERIADAMTDAFHLAALYNLAAPRRRSYEVNVEGTRQVLDLVARARGLERFVHISTIVVSGDRTGTIYEDELECGQRFRNFYEETKYLSEVEVRRRRGEIPTAIVRPAVVIGDSRTGEIDKYDGPYYLVAALARLEREKAPAWRARMLTAGTADALFHLVPVDFLVETMHAVIDAPVHEVLGKTFHVIDPNELRVGAVRRLVLDRFGIPDFPVRVPPAAVRALFRVPGMEKVAQMPRQALDYMDLENRYDDERTRALTAARGIECARLPEYMDRLVAYVRAHPEIPVQILKK